MFKGGSADEENLLQLSKFLELIIFKSFSFPSKVLKTLPIIYMLVCRIILYPSSPWTLWTSVTGVGAEFSTRRLDFLFFVLAAWIWMESDFSLMFRGRLLLRVRSELKDDPGPGP